MDKLVNPNVYIFRTAVKKLTKKIVDSRKRKLYFNLNELNLFDVRWPADPQCYIT